LSSRREPSPAFPRVLVPLPPRRSGYYTRGVRKWICWREWRRVTPYLLPYPADPLPVPRVQKTAPRLLPPKGRAPLSMSSSEEGDLESTAEEASPQSVQYEELLEVVTRAVAKLNIDWPAEERVAPQRSKLDERFLQSKPPSPRRSLPFFPDLHAEIARSWERPYSARLFVPASDYYGNVAGLDERAYKAMARVEQTLASYLSPGVASSLKAPTLPSKGTWQQKVDLEELRRTADLTLRATKETARAVGRSMAVMVAAERHLWLTLSDMKEKDRAFLLDAPLEPSGLFGDAVNSVVSRYQEARKQAAAFQRYLPRRSLTSAAAGHE
ncbi:hypothetical protein M9458_039639, partial [Cirrhinus mrigala]